MSLAEKQERKGKKRSSFRNYLKSIAFQRLIIGLITIFAAFSIILNGAIPRKYRLTLGDKSNYDITAPREIENKLKTEENARAAAEAVPPAMIKLDNVPIEVLNTADDFFTTINLVRESIERSIRSQNISENDRNYSEKLELEQELAEKRLTEEMKAFNLPLSD